MNKKLTPLKTEMRCNLISSVNEEIKNRSDGGLCYIIWLSVDRILKRRIVEDLANLTGDPDNLQRPIL